MMSPLTQRRYRRALAWLGFITLYVGAPVLIIAGIYQVSQLGVTTYDRDAFLSAAHNRN